MDVTLGIDIGGTNTKLGLVTRNGTCPVHTSIETEAHKPVENFITNLCIAVEQLKVEIGEGHSIKAVGVGAPNANYYTGYIENAPNLDWGEKVPLAKLIQDKVHLPIWITNDANAAALGEMKFGVAQGMKNFVVITLGTGLGSGFVMDGRLVYGHDGFAGEMGHITCVPGGRMHTTGLKGSLETYVSATGIKKTLFELLANRVEDSRLRRLSFDEVEAKDINEAALEGDVIAQEAFHITGTLLGQALHDVVVMYDPEAIIIFGGLAKAGSLIMDPTEKSLNALLPSVYANKVKLLSSNLQGHNTAILGSSALAWQEWEEMEKAEAAAS